MLYTVTPILGVFISSIQLSSPFKAMLECNRLQSLGTMNPTPIVVCFFSCFGWMIYSTALGNFYLMLSVLFGTIINFYSIISALYLLGVQNRRAAARNMGKLLQFGSAVWIVVAFMVGVVIKDLSLSISFIGYIASATTIIYYFSPLSSLVQILQTKDASSLYFPTLALNMVGCILWSSYGLFGIRDYNVWVPSAFGLMLTVIQLCLKFYFDRMAYVAKKNSGSYTNVVNIPFNDSERSVSTLPTMSHRSISVTVSNEGTNDALFSAGDLEANNRLRAVDNGPILSGTDEAGIGLSLAGMVTEELQTMTTEATGFDDSTHSAASSILDIASSFLAPFGPSLSSASIVALESTNEINTYEGPTNIIGVLSSAMSSFEPTLPSVQEYAYSAVESPLHDALNSSCSTPVVVTSDSVNVSEMISSTIALSTKEDTGAENVELNARNGILRSSTMVDNLPVPAKPRRYRSADAATGILSWTNVDNDLSPRGVANQSVISSASDDSLAQIHEDEV